MISISSISQQPAKQHEPATSQSKRTNTRTTDHRPRTIDPAFTVSFRSLAEMMMVCGIQSYCFGNGNVRRPGPGAQKQCKSTRAPGGWRINEELPRQPTSVLCFLRSSSGGCSRSVAFGIRSCRSPLWAIWNSNAAVTGCRVVR